MPHLLVKLQGNKYVNHSFFRPYLYIYDDSITYKKRRKVFWVDEITASYNHMVQVNLHKGIWFAKLEFVNTGAEDIVIKGVWKGPASKAKKIVDQKVYQAHNKDHHSIDPKEKHQITNIERGIQRLKELHNKGKISDRDFKKRKKQLLKKIR